MGKGIMDIGVVIVTFNRVEKLKTALLNFDVQSILPAYIIVVDNASSDETPAFLGKWENDKKRYMKKVIRMNQNKGGSGGCYTRLQESLKLKRYVAKLSIKDRRIWNIEGVYIQGG